MTRTKTLQIFEFQRKLFFVLIAALFVTILSYAYLLNNTIQNVVFVDNNHKLMADLRSSLSTLENEYLAKENNLTLEYAHSLGFVDDVSPIYLSVGSFGTALTFSQGLNIDAQ